MPVMRYLPSLCAALALGCTAPEPAQTVRERFFAMGTWVDVTFESPDASTAGTALGEIETMLRRVERDYYPWADGMLARMNRAIAAGEETTVSAELAALLVRAKALSLATDGLFEPGMGRLVELWGFHTTALEPRAPPSDQAIDAALEASGGIAALAVEGTRVRSARRGLLIDLGGIAKGAAVAGVLTLLETHGITGALVNAGGDLAVRGTARAGRPWRVGIRHPRRDGLLGILELGDGEAVFTSGDYERYYERDGERMHHLIDPRTGRPATHTQALTVLHDDPTLADAAATALFVAGPERWRAVARNLGLEAVLRVDATGTVEMTEAMSARLEPAEAAHDIIAGSGQE